ncbi:hypothetical protein [Novipirellula artificiosorum]|uniref:Uncharacterized protein n=1 Tax=Novipirellula artificiosorum TaxID=2528016 RepID=A0A5C6DST3_9BACT|nr:hypothetical protein [Novipirellula artificiosorum]TWU39722.1 hypothetical protein Poly41_25780 [Novipirellula artificiosorum]
MADSQPAPSRHLALHRIPNSLVVLVAVALLLQGPVGAFEAFWIYTKSLVLSLLGGEDLLIQVLFQTAPLALATAAVTFAIRFGWLRFRSPTALVICSAVIIVATWIGGQLRYRAATKQWIKPSLASATQRTSVSLNELRVQNVDAPASRDDSSVSLKEACGILADGDFGRFNPQAAVPRVSLMPESGSLLGIIGRGLNQLLGYLVVYQPRLFLAAIILGAYIGCSLQSLLKDSGLVRSRIHC